LTEDSGKEQVRIDRWLWAARFFKTRSQAAAAIDGGKVHVNGNSVKRAKLIAVNDMVRVRKGPYEFQLQVCTLSERRGPAPEAQKLYQETQESQDERQRVAEAHALAKAMLPTPIFHAGGRPTKKDRRALAKFKHGSPDED
jgi:ribosome-associated heat shock protein Hsp15